MLTKEVKIRVRYGETDKMGYVYHGVYASYYEIARTELMRDLDLSYKSLEDRQIMLPVYEMNMKFKAPAFYDDELRVRATIKQLPQIRFRFDIEIFNEQNRLINEGFVTLIFVDAHSRKPCRPPQDMLQAMAQYFEKA